MPSTKSSGATYASTALPCRAWTAGATRRRPGSQRSLASRTLLFWALALAVLCYAATASANTIPDEVLEGAQQRQAVEVDPAGHATPQGEVLPVDHTSIQEKVVQDSSRGSRGLRIGIIGGGCAGLVAADELRRLGYQHVTVYEAEARAGGKTLSHRTPDGVVSELGTVWLSTTYDMLNELAARYNVDIEVDRRPLRFFPTATPADDDEEVHAFFPYTLGRYSLVEAAEGLLYFWKLARQYPFLGQPGFQDADPSFFVPFADFVRAHPPLEPVAYTFLPLWAACGYTYFETVPALYIMKFLQQILTLPNTVALTSVVLEPLLRRIAPEGLQLIWTRMAADLPDVRLGHAVKRVTRPSAGCEGPILVESIRPDGTVQAEEYDRLIVSTDPQLAVQTFLEASAEEAELFGLMQTTAFQVDLLRVEGLPADDYPDGFEAVLDSLDQAHEGYPVYAVKTGPCHVVTGQVVSDGATDEELSAKLQEGLQSALGVSVAEVVASKRWRYFPRVHTQGLLQGFYPRLDKLQGQRGTYYVGGLMNFETLEMTAIYSRWLVQRAFGDP